MWIESLAHSIPLPVYRLFIRRKVIGFCYHAIAETPPAHIRHLIPSKTPAQFEGDLLYLGRHFTPISYAQLWEHFNRGTRLPRRAAIITFDDGYAECFSVVRPLLLKHGIPAAFFLITDSLDNRALSFRNAVSLCIEAVSALDETARQAVFSQLSEALGQAITSLQGFTAWLKPLRLDDWALIEMACRFAGVDMASYLATHQPYLNRRQIEIMLADGFTFGAHSRRHPKLKFLSPAAAAEEIVVSCQVVADLTGQKSVPFAFPFSADGVEREFLARLRRDYPVIGLMFDTNGVQLTGRFIQSRVAVDDTEYSPADESSLPNLLQRAYADVLLWKARRLGFETKN